MAVDLNQKCQCELMALTHIQVCMHVCEDKYMYIP